MAPKKGKVGDNTPKHPAKEKQVVKIPAISKEVLAGKKERSGL